MRNFLYIPLLLFLILQSGGYFFMYKIRQYAIRMEVKEMIHEGLSADKQVLIKISSLRYKDRFNEFTRIKSDEFRYNGKMYDIIKEEKHGDETWFYCYQDEKETGLINRFTEHARNKKNKQQDNENTIQQILQLMNAPYFFSQNEFLFFEHTQNHPASFYTFCIISWQKAPPFHPPKFRIT